MAVIQTPTGPQDVASINAAREQAVSEGNNPYAGAGATNLSNSAGLQNTPPGLPSSSASIILNKNASTATDNASASITNPDAAPDYSSLYSSIGGAFPSLTPDVIKGLNLAPSDLANLGIAADQTASAQKNAQDEKSQQDSAYRDQLAQTNASFASAKATLDQQRSDSLDTAKAQLASLNSSGGIGSDSGQFMSHIGAQYDLAENQLAFQAEQAQAALEAGNLQAYNSIQDNMAQTIAGTRTNVQNLLAAASANKTQAAQFAQGEQDKATTAYSSSLQNIPQPETIAALPTNYSALTPAQLQTLQNTSAYQTGIKAGMTPQAILADVQTAATNSKIAITKQKADETAQNDLVKAQIAMFNAQTSAANATESATRVASLAALPNGSAYSAAAASIGSQMSKGGQAQLETNLINLLATNNAPAAKQTLTTAILNPKGTGSGFDAAMANVAVVAQTAPALIAKINALPADQQSGLLKGTINDVATRLGQNPDPKLQEIGMELQHIAPIYALAAGGVRAAATTANGQSTFAKLLPNAKDTASLSITDLQAFVNTATDLSNAALQARLDPATYQSIYGGSQSAPTPSGSVPSFSFGGITFTAGQQFLTSDGKTAVMGSDGKPTLVQ